MSDSLHTKRLHVSGITSTMRQTDLVHLLSSFGRVQAVDGFGALDALGDPRKFVFVTMEMDARALGKCLNALSGSTWKGAKLRISEARPDFRERLVQINSQPPRPVRPKRIRLHNSGQPSSYLPLVPLSPVAAASAPGWVITPSGRIVRPLRMRPERPLEPMHNELSAKKCLNGKVKKRTKSPPVRARRRLIDPTKWDSVYLKGIFLDAVPVPLPASEDPTNSPTEPELVSTIDVRDEVDCALATMRTIFMEESAEDQESAEENNPRKMEIQVIDDSPRTNLKTLFVPREEAPFSLLDHLELDLDIDPDAKIFGDGEPTGVPHQNTQYPEAISSTCHISEVPAEVSRVQVRPQLATDTSHPLLFPPADTLPHPCGSSSKVPVTSRWDATSPCYLFSTTVRGLGGRFPSSISFTRPPQDTSESIREMWETDKSSLTYDWKKAWREARSCRRGRVGAESDIFSSY